MNDSFEIAGQGAKSPLFHIGRFENDTVFSQNKAFNHFTVILIESAKAEFTADTITYPLVGSNLLSFSLYQPFQIRGGGQCRGFMVKFHPDFFCLHHHRAEVSCNGVLFNNIYESPLTELSQEENNELLSIMNALFSEMRRAIFDTEVLISYLKILLINASRIKVSRRGSSSRSVATFPGTLAELQRIIESKFRTIHSAAAVADLMHLSQGTLNNICKKYYNKTLSNLIGDRIILEAKRELYLSRASVKSIAYGLGFSDEFHFSRYFKRKVNIAPQQFRDTVGSGKGIAG